VDRFIVGTGRCGSTLLSRMLAESPEVLGIFEFFNGLDFARRFSDLAIAGGEFAALISAEQPVVTAVLRRGYDVPEITYPFGGRSRFARTDPLPWILVSTLPRLTDDPDRLFDETVAFAAAQPRQHLANHYRALFDWWCTRGGCRHWIERSGSSVEYLESLGRLFPGARFLHLHRDGPETALSMREHHAYRLPVALRYGPAEVTRAVGGGLDSWREPDPDDPISRILSSRPPVEYYGRYWCEQVLRGYRAVRRLDADQYRELRFEELIESPRAVLRELCDFFELDPQIGAWTETAAGLVHGMPPARLPGLSEREREGLVRECRPASVLLGRAG